MVTAEEFDRAMESGETVRLLFPRSQYHKVREWHEAFGLPVANEPTMLPEGRRDLRWELIQEELHEAFEAIDDGDLEHAAKEIGDLAWVVNGLAVEMGLDLDLILTRIYTSNMSKLGEDGKPVYREDGKVLKGPNYVETDLTGLV